MLGDGSLAYLQARGYRHGPGDVMAELAKGAKVDPAKYYFRLYLQFETSSSIYVWLNRPLAVGNALRLGNAVVYDAYAIGLPARNDGALTFAASNEPPLVTRGVDRVRLPVSFEG